MSDQSKPDEVTETDEKDQPEIGGRAYERENYEPKELENPLPKWFSLLSLGFVIWGASYFFMQGWGSTDAGDQRRPPPPAGTLPVNGGVVYAANCTACHQTDGAGLANAFPPLDGSGWVIGEPELAAQILVHGMQGPIEVKGATYSGVMPSMAHLSDAELAAVLNYIRNAWSNNAQPVKLDYFEQVRERFGERGPWQGGAELRSEIGEPAPPGDS